MRIIRFIADDGDILIGEDRGDGTAAVLLDTRGLLDPGLRATASDILPGKRVLVADDDANIREMVRAVLQKSGCACTLCRDGAETLRAIEEQSFDFVISDIMMPHHNGYEVFAAARNRDPDLPVLLITGFGYDPSHALVRAADEGHNEVLYKPFTPRQLQMAMIRAMGARDGPSSPGGWGLVRTEQMARIDRRLAPGAPRTILCLGGAPAITPQDGEPTDVLLELFMKPASSVIGPGEVIHPPSFPGGQDNQLDGEGELTVIIGREAKQISESEVRDYIFGYTAANDITARRFQNQAGPGAWMRGKGFDGFCPLGPAIIPDAEIDDPNKLVVRTLVNGTTVRESTLADRGRSVEAFISALSRRITLRPGAVILLGASPRLSTDLSSGGGALQEGDEISVIVDDIGVLTNSIGGEPTA